MLDLIIDMAILSDIWIPPFYLPALLLENMESYIYKFYDYRIVIPAKSLLALFYITYILCRVELFRYSILTAPVFSD